jgi:hypothetical protein
MPPPHEQICPPCSTVAPLPQDLVVLCSECWPSPHAFHLETLLPSGGPVLGCTHLRLYFWATIQSHREQYLQLKAFADVTTPLAATAPPLGKLASLSAALQPESSGRISLTVAMLSGAHIPPMTFGDSQKGHIQTL